jgi:hypothetical protein
MEEEFTLDGYRDVGWKEDAIRTEHYFETIINKQMLPLEKWGFQLTYKNFNPSFISRTLIYDNETCRVKIKYYLERRKQEDYIEVRYGRKHASNTEGTIVWQGEECHCWHMIQWHVIRFLEGKSAAEAKKEFLIPPEYIQEYKDSVEGRELMKKWGPTYDLKIESLIWERYGAQLFQLFDLRDIRLWDRYYEFNKEYWATDDPTPYDPHAITMDKIC